MTFEFYGTIRLRAGVASTEIESETLGQALQRLAEALPALANSVIFGDAVHRAFRASLNSERFVSDPATPLARGDRVLLVAADVGG